MKIRKLTNVSELDVMVTLCDGNAIRVPASGVLENVDIQNLSDIRPYVRVEQDLSEVPVTEARTYLKG